MSRRVVYYAAVSLDGFIADAEGGVGWLDAFQIEGQDFGYAEFYSSAAAVVMGRTTYEQLLDFDIPFPYGDKATYVVSTRRDIEPAADSVTVVADPVELLSRLRAEAGDGLVWLVGGGKLAAAAWDAGLIDELRWFMMPVLLGDGVPVIAIPHAPRAVSLGLTREWSDGVVELRYAVGGRL